MIKIYRYDFSEGFRAVVNDRELKGKERDEAIEKWIKDNGTEVSVKDYFSDRDRNSFNKEYAYRCDGNPENCIERLADAELNSGDDLSYCWIRENSPEDLVESRTDWDEMKDHADGLARFIESLKEEIADGIIFAKSQGNSM